MAANIGDTWTKTGGAWIRFDPNPSRYAKSTEDQTRARLEKLIEEGKAPVPKPKIGPSARTIRRANNRATKRAANQVHTGQDNSQEHHNWDRDQGYFGWYSSQQHAGWYSS